MNYETGRTMDPSQEVNLMSKRHANEQFPGLNEALVEQYVPEHLQNQLSGMFDLYRSYNEKLPKPLTEDDFRFLETFYLGFLADRARRSEEIDTPEYEEVIKKANDLMPMATFMVMCMDGRVKPIHTNGFAAGIGSAIRTPAGMINDFVRKDGELVIEPNTNFAKLIKEKLKKYDNVAEVFDSHWTCAARIGEEASTGSHPNDNGLLSDVLLKKEMIQASKKLLEQMPEAKDKNTAFIQTTFNPYTGFIYMGLERDEALEYAKSVKRDEAIKNGDNPDEEQKYAEYNKAVLKELIANNQILSTGHFRKDPVMQEALERHKFDADWQRNYVATATQFWNGIETLWGEVGQHLKGKIVSLYPHLKMDSENARKELDERTMLLLTNWFNGSLHNHNHNEMDYLDMDDELYEEQEHYEYDQHMEQGVKVSEGGHPPYDIMMFVVYNGDEENLPDWIELASGIVRKNRSRANHPIKDPTRPDRKPYQVERLPVPVVMQEIIRNDENVTISEDDWKAFEQIDWSDLPKEWNTMEHNEFRDYLIGKGIGNALLHIGIQKLRRRMARIYEPQTKTAPHLKELYKTAVPIVCDEKRKVHAIIPFAKVGRHS